MAPIPVRLPSVSQSELMASREFPTTYWWRKRKPSLVTDGSGMMGEHCPNTGSSKAPSWDTLKGQWWRKIPPVGRNSGSPPGHLPERTNSLTKAGLATAPAERPICQHQRPALWPQSCTITWGVSQLTDGSLVPLNHFHSGGSNSLLLLAQTMDYTKLLL